MTQDPVDFMRRESFNVVGNGVTVPTASSRPKIAASKVNIDRPKDEIILSDEDEEEEKQDALGNPLEQPDFIDELETVYQDANDEIVQYIETAGNKQGHSKNKQQLQ